MRHGKKINHLGRTASHRKAMLSNMASSLLVNKRVNTTLAKAKELRKYVEPLITKAKNDSMHARRVVFSYLKDKESVKALFNEVVDRIAERPGGYTRIIKLGSRLGDNAEMAMIELVDFNDLLIKEEEAKKGKSRRRRGGKKSKDAADKDATPKAKKGETVVEETKDAKPEATAVEEVTPDDQEAVVEESKAEEVEEVESVAEVVQEAEIVEEPKAETPEVTEEEESEEKGNDEEAEEKPKS
jgi:large subunit ribosomal protein L17